MAAMIASGIRIIRSRACAWLVAYPAADWPVLKP